MATSGNKPSHLRALLKKNWILWKRSWCVSCLEIIIPALFVFILVAFKQAIPTEDIAENSYYDNPSWRFSYDGTLTSADNQYFKYCAADENGGVVALVPTGDSLLADLEPILSKRSFLIPLKHDSIGNDLGLDVQYFGSVAEIDAFTNRNDYASTANLRLCFGIIVNKNNVGDKYDYSFMFNTTNDDIPRTSEQRIADLKR